MYGRNHASTINELLGKLEVRLHLNQRSSRLNIILYLISGNGVKGPQVYTVKRPCVPLSRHMNETFVGGSPNL